MPTLTELLRAVLPWSVFGLLIIPAHSQTSIPNLAKPPVIDGVHAPGEWAHAAEVSLTYQTQPGNNSRPSERTRVWLGMDDANFYVAALAEDQDARQVRGRVRARDDLANDEDVIWITLDTFHDRRRAYMFVVNPAGVQADGIYTEGAGDDFSWDGIFSSGGKMTANGYTVELAIPFRTLRFRNSRDLVWGVHLERVIPRKNEKMSWVPIDRQVSGYLIQAGEIRLQRGEHTGRASVADVIPTVTGAAQWERTGPLTANRFFKADPGLTVNSTGKPLVLPVRHEQV